MWHKRQRTVDEKKVPIIAIGPVTTAGTFMNRNPRLQDCVVRTLISLSYNPGLCDVTNSTVNVLNALMAVCHKLLNMENLMKFDNMTTRSQGEL